MCVAAAIHPVTIARITSPSTSSSTAAPKMMRASRVCIFERSRSTRAVMPMLVAASAAPRKTCGYQLPLPPDGASAADARRAEAQAEDGTQQRHPRGPSAYGHDVANREGQAHLEEEDQAAELGDDVDRRIVAKPADGSESREIAERGTREELPEDCQLPEAHRQVTAGLRRDEHDGERERQLRDLM